jgi:hypothetical protein
LSGRAWPARARELHPKPEHDRCARWIAVGQCLRQRDSCRAKSHIDRTLAKNLRVRRAALLVQVDRNGHKPLNTAFFRFLGIEPLEGLDIESADDLRGWGLGHWCKVINCISGSCILNPNFPAVTGRYQMTREWWITLPGEFNRRVEDGSLVLWRPGLTVWVLVWGNDHSESTQVRLDGFRTRKSSLAFDEEMHHDGDVTRYSYRLTEQDDDGPRSALYAFAIGMTGHVQAAIYFDDETQLAIAKQIWMSFEEVTTA